MSYINSALKKVQQERDNRYASYGDTTSSQRGKKCWTERWRVFVIPSVVAVIIALLSVFAYVRYQAAARPVKDAAAVGISKVAPVAEETGAPVAVPGEDKERLSRAAKLYGEALKAQRGDRRVEAENFYKQALSFDPRHVQSLNNLGVLHMSKERYDEATELFVKAIAVKNDYVDPYYNLACLYAQLGNVKASLEHLEQAAKMDGGVRKWAKDDADFKTLRSLPEFKKITE